MSILFPRRRRRRTSKPKQRRSRGRLHLELLEQRHVLAVTLAPLLDVEAPAGKWILAPLTAVDDSGGPVTFDVQITDDDLSWSLAGAAGKSLALEVAGVDAQGNDFSGTVIVRLFDEAAPQAVARIEQLAAAGSSAGASFLRVLAGLFAELGGPGTGMPLDDEFSDELTFNSPGLLAMASAGPDGGDAEFFLTAVYAAGSTDPISLADMPQELNFRRTIVGQLVAGFDVFAQVMSVETLTDGDDAGAPLQPVTIVSAQVIDDVQNGVLRVFVPAGFVGGSAVVTVTAMGADMEMAAQSFTLLAVANDADDPPFLGPVGDAETAVGAATSLTLTATHL
ncbi:MAG TPA: peptidylprolyl isomerase, partial [Lacipirellulaceae bacterium]|nr:peptidylprolyl isomerase [Lacipirellulaceae bacterium]